MRNAKISWTSRGEIMGEEISLGEELLNQMDLRELVERLADLEHEQWMYWSKSIAEKQNISEEKLQSWRKLWIPYGDLSEEDKEHDRKWARKALGIVENHLQKELGVQIHKVAELAERITTSERPAYKRVLGMIEPDLRSLSGLDNDDCALTVGEFKELKKKLLG